MEEKMLIFELFCQNVQITINNKLSIANGVQYLLSANGMNANMNIYTNGNTYSQGAKNSLLNTLRLWDGRVSAPSNISHGGMVALNMGWKDWWEERNYMVEFHKKYGEPTEDQGSDEYKYHREILFHDYMFRKAANHKKIDIHKVRFVVENWLKHYCFMNMNAQTIMSDVYSRIQDQYSSYIEGDLVPFDIVVDELSYIMVQYCGLKMIAETDKFGKCPIPGRDTNNCIMELVDALYIYCENQSVIKYHKTNLHKFLAHKEDETSWQEIKFDSPIEKLMFDGLQQAGLLNIPQFQACAPANKYRVDYVIKTNSGWSIAVECDGLEYHANKQNYYNDRQRDRLLALNGFYMMRFSGPEIFNNLQSCVDEVDKVFWLMQKDQFNYRTSRSLGYFGHI